MRVLIISYHFPPSRAIGAVRAGWLADGLAGRGHEVAVIASGVGGQESPHRVWRGNRVSSLVEAALTGLRALRRRRSNGRAASGVVAKRREPWRDLLPDRNFWWVIEAIPGGMRTASRFTPDVIFASGRPFSAFTVGSVVAGLLGVPLVLDLRDPWTVWHEDHHWLGVAAERWLFNQASAIVLNTRSCLQAYEEQYPGLRERMVAVPNAITRNGELKAPPTDPLVILYGGNLYGRSFDGLLKGFHKFVTDAGLTPEEARLVFIGTFQPGTFSDQVVKRLGDYVEILPFLPKDEYESRLSSASVGVVHIGDWDLCIPGKFYDLLGKGLPILLLSSSTHELRATLEEVGFGIGATHDDEKEIAEALHHLRDDLLPTFQETLESVDLSSFRVGARLDRIESILKAAVAGRPIGETERKRGRARLEDE